MLLDKNEQTIDIDLQWKEMVLDELRAAHGTGIRTLIIAISNQNCRLLRP
ncbi:MAG: hypothetical protein IPM92_08015 [Saprospiraceae bacterium]|nr:hypothetical protein [Saprospiraceae bacterium]